MSRFLESDEFNPANMVAVDGYGFCLALRTMPSRHDIRWLKLPERHVYFFDEDGWYRLSPPENKFLPAGELAHG